MSVSKITKALNCSVTFSSDCCVIQDHMIGNKIGSGAENGDLYFFADGENPSPVALQFKVSPNQHHCHLVIRLSRTSNRWSHRVVMSSCFHMKFVSLVNIVVFLFLLE